jgi:tetratricopeptide (TPR) repeat protein
MRFGRTSELLARFDREANISAQLNHPNIVQVIDRGKDGETLFIVMEYVEGESLDKLIRSRRLSLPQTLDFAMQVCDALEYAHAKGVVHRDLKPSNILIDTQAERAKIADFGIAQLETTGAGLSTLTTEHAALGTMNYMSPEQRLDSHRVTYHTDIFSFGVILYEMLTGKLPIGHFKLPSFVNHDVPIGLDAVVSKCLAEGPGDRYQGAAAIKEDLGRVTGRHARLRKVAKPARGSLWRNKWLYAAAMTAALLLGAVAFLLVRGRHPVPSTVADAGEPTQSGTSEPVVEDRSPPVPGTVVDVREPTRSEASGGVLDARLRDEVARARRLLAGGKPREALPLLMKIVQEHSGSAAGCEAHVAMAEAYAAAGDYETAALEYENLLRTYPNAAEVPEVILGKCSAQWKTTPTHGLLKKSYYAPVQERLVQELQRIVSGHPKSGSVPGALSLIAEISQQPDLNDFKTAADSLMVLYSRQPKSGPDSLFQAATLYDEKVGDRGLARAAYERFVIDFPNDGRARNVRKRLDVLRAQ